MRSKAGRLRERRRRQRLTPQSEAPARPSPSGAAASRPNRVSHLWLGRDTLLQVCFLFRKTGTTAPTRKAAVSIGAKNAGSVLRGKADFNKSAVTLNATDHPLSTATHSASETSSLLNLLFNQPSARSHDTQHHFVTVSAGGLGPSRGTACPANGRTADSGQTADGQQDSGRTGGRGF